MKQSEIKVLKTKLLSILATWLQRVELNQNIINTLIKVEQERRFKEILKVQPSEIFGTDFNNTFNSMQGGLRVINPELTLDYYKVKEALNIKYVNVSGSYQMVYLSKENFELKSQAEKVIEDLEFELTFTDKTEVSKVVENFTNLLK